MRLVFLFAEDGGVVRDNLSREAWGLIASGRAVGSRLRIREAMAGFMSSWVC